MEQQPIYSEQQLDQVKQAYESAMKQREQAIINQTSAFKPGNNNDLVKWQLELDNILERIDHLLRGHKLKFKEGNLIWTEPDDDEEKIFNDYGVNEILRILSMYLNRNTILSNYTEEMIEFKVYDIGNEMSDLILNKYEDMGLNTKKKMIIYPMIIRELIDIIHSSYLRALKGGERESLREARTVTQTIPMGNGLNMNGQGLERGLLNPMRYINGKYR